MKTHFSFFRRGLCPYVIQPLAALVLAASGQAASYMFDFGPTTVSGTALTNSPYHAAGGSLTDNTWNKVELADISGTLVSSTGLAGAGISINLGTSATQTIDLTAAPGSTNALGGGTPSATGIYASPSVARDGIFNTTGARYLGMQVGGLASGTYDIYVMARNTNTSAAHSQLAYVGTSAAAGNFNSTSYPMALSLIPTTASGADGGQAAWEQGVNYMKFTVTLAAGEYLNIVTNGGNGVAGAGGSEARGFLNAVQIMEVPEVSSFALAALGLGAAAARRRRG